MKRLSILVICAFAFSVQAQVVEPKKPAAIKFKTSAPVTAKANEHIVIDASSALGETWFFYDEQAFPKGRATTAGKLLVLSTNVNGKYTVDVVSFQDGQKEKVTFTVTGGVDPVTPIPKPPDPKPVDPIEQINATLAKIEARLAVLEQSKPNPPKPKPPDPGDPIATAIQGAWQQEFAADKKDSAAKVAQCYRAAVTATATATSWGDLSSAIKKKSSELGVTGKLPVVSKTIVEQLIADGFPASPSVLMVAGDADRAKTTFNKIISALETLP